jgi:hypothetical protein
MSRARGLRMALAGAACLAAACAWHTAGEVDAVTEPPLDLPAPQPGMELPAVLDLASSVERGSFAVWADILRIVAVKDGVWKDLRLAEVRRPAFTPDPATDYVVVVKRTCRDWEGRQRWSDVRMSWFLLPGGRLAAYDHWTFGPRCAVADRFRPAAEGSPARTTERDLLRWLEQRHPQGRLPIELRFQRGEAFVEAGRLDEARALLRFGDDAIEARDHLHRPREESAAESGAFQTEQARLRRLRADLSTAIRRAEAERSPPPGGSPPAP